MDDPLGADGSLVPFGYAPGGYIFTCLDCGPQDFMDRPTGSKHCTRCAEHAQAKKEAFDALPVEEPTKDASTTILWREWKDGSITAASGLSRTQLDRQIEKDKLKAKRIWQQVVEFDPKKSLKIHQQST